MLALYTLTLTWCSLAAARHVFTPPVILPRTVAALDTAAAAEAQQRDDSATRAFSNVQITTSDGRCLFVDKLSGDFRENLTPIQVAACGSTDGQGWDLVTAGKHNNVPGSALVVSSLTNACLNFDPRRAAGNQVLLFSCGGRADGGGDVTNSQLFALNSTSGPLSLEPENAAGSCVTVKGNVLDIASCDSSDAKQQFTFGSAAATLASTSRASAAGTSTTAVSGASVVSSVTSSASSSSASASSSSVSSVSSTSSISVPSSCTRRTRTVVMTVTTTKKKGPSLSPSASASLSGSLTAGIANGAAAVSALSSSEASASVTSSDSVSASSTSASSDSLASATLLTSSSASASSFVSASSTATDASSSTASATGSLITGAVTAIAVPDTAVPVSRGGNFSPSAAADANQRDDTATRAFSDVAIRAPNGQCLFVDPTAGDFRENLVPISLVDCAGTPNEKWDVITAGVHNDVPGTALIVSTLTNGCISFDSRRATNDTVNMFPCGGRADGSGETNADQLMPFIGALSFAFAPTGESNSTCILPGDGRLVSGGCPTDGAQLFSVIP
ncbi:iron-sulfur protein [Ophiostoma piceae UAMH 11346]|uniref:Iron-sulfur protein n=1 Tax=Ophiostoma piceae (strain UAMH 11346) TaxID=1262450 RepID=S3C4W5_OPHP1|nr:iron-sulfur protein [Ophiostoma piceae UAMH 11346]